MSNDAFYVVDICAEGSSKWQLVLGLFHRVHCARVSLLAQVLNPIYTWCHVNVEHAYFMFVILVHTYWNKMLKLVFILIDMINTIIKHIQTHNLQFNIVCWVTNHRSQAALQTKLWSYLITEYNKNTFTINVVTTDRPSKFVCNMNKCEDSMNL